MKRTPALERATHPLIFAAASLVLLNDIVLRPLWPDAWWTGKLSTLAAAFAIPLLLAALFSLFFPRRWKLASALAFGLVLVALVLLKAAPETNRWLTGWLPVRAVADPSDLLAVIPWLAALWFTFAPAHAPRPLTAPRLLLIPLAALFLLADAAMPDYGAACLSVQDQSLLTRAGYMVYLSNDGGRTWAVTELPDPIECFSAGLDAPVELTAPGGVRYRVNPGSSVERSADGASWEPVFTSNALSEPEYVYIRRTVSGNLTYQPGPLDARIDPAGDNLVLAMGMEGVLIVPPTGEPQWAAVGPYRRASLRAAGLEGYLTILGGEIWLALGAALAWLATAMLRLRRSTWQTVLTVLGWLLLIAAGIAQHPSINTGYLAAFSSIGLLAACAWSLVLVLVALFRMRGRPLHPFTRRVLFVPLFIAVFLLPYAAWALGLLPLYWISQSAAAALTVAMVGLLN